MTEGIKNRGFTYPGNESLIDSAIGVSIDKYASDNPEVIKKMTEGSPIDISIFISEVPLKSRRK